MADHALAGARWWRPAGRSRPGRSPRPHDLASLRGDLRWAVLAFAAAALLTVAWHPWTVLGAASAANAQCGVVFVNASDTVHVTATGPGAAEWCAGEISRAPARTATSESAGVPTAAQCDFYVGSAHVMVSGGDPADATAFCNSLGSIRISP